MPSPRHSSILAMLLIPTCARAIVIPEACGGTSFVGVCIAETHVMQGTIITIYFQAATGKSFGWNYAVYINDTSTYSNYLYNPSLTAAQDAVPFGDPFTLNLDTLNWPGGRYAIKASMYIDYIDIAPPDSIVESAIRQDMLAGVGSTIALYNNDDGTRVGRYQPGDPTSSAVNFNVGKVMVVGINLAGYVNLRNRIDIKLVEDEGNAMNGNPIIQALMLQDGGMNDRMAILPQEQDGRAPKCAASIPVLDFAAVSAIDGTAPSGIVIVRVRAPEHIERHSLDGVQLYVFAPGNPVEAGDAGCYDHGWTTPGSPGATYMVPHFVVTLRDSQTKPAIPTRPEEMPALDTFNVKFVRYAGQENTLSGDAELADLAASVASKFVEATKGWFNMKVANDGVVHQTRYSDVVGLHDRVIAWYGNSTHGIPKTPNSNGETGGTAGLSSVVILNTSNADELFLATLLYYYEHNENDYFAADLVNAYPPKSSGEDLTIYWFDGVGALGRGMGTVGAARIKILRLFPGSLFYTGTGDARTYHYDLEGCSKCGGTTAEYLQYMEATGSQDGLQSTTLHEMGHALWSGRVGVNFGDTAMRRLPFANKKTIVIDRSAGYFTRKEFMSYGRDRTNLEGMEYGDAALARLIAAYDPPVGTVVFEEEDEEDDEEEAEGAGEQEAVSLPSAHGTVMRGINADVAIVLGASAGSGVAKLTCMLVQAPKAFGLLNNGTVTKHTFQYTIIPKRVRMVAERLTLSSQTVEGVYTYRYTVESQLHGKPGVVNAHCAAYTFSFTVVDGVAGGSGNATKQEEAAVYSGNVECEGVDATLLGGDSGGSGNSTTSPPTSPPTTTTTTTTTSTKAPITCDARRVPDCSVVKRGQRVMP